MPINLNPPMLPPNNELGFNRLSPQVSTGQRINSAADDAAGSAIAERLTTGVNGIAAATRNVGDGMSMLETRSGLTGELTDRVQRMSELAVQSGNPTLSTTDIAALDSEFTDLRDSIMADVSSARFNGEPLFGQNGQSLQTGPDAGDTTERPGNSLAETLEEQGFGALSLSEAQETGDVINSLGEAQTALTDTQVQDGAAYNQLATRAESLTQTGLDTTQARSRIEDAEIGQVASNLAQQAAREQASLLTQSQANAGREDVLRLL